MLKSMLIVGCCAMLGLAYCCCGSGSSKCDAGQSCCPTMKKSCQTAKPCPAAPQNCGAKADCAAPVVVEGVVGEEAAVPAPAPATQK